MKFRVGREALGEAVAWVARALPSRPVVPVLSGLLLDADGDGLTLSCFDYEVSAGCGSTPRSRSPGRRWCQAACWRRSPVACRPWPWRSRPMPTWSASPAAAPSSRWSRCLAEEYPALPEPPPRAGTLDGGVLAAAAAQVVPAASRDDTLPMLTAVCLDIDGETHDAGRHRPVPAGGQGVPWPPAAPGLRAAAMVPARTLADVARSMAPGAQVTVAFEAGQPGRGCGGCRGSARAGIRARPTA